jgi:hypothetical protein
MIVASTPAGIIGRNVAYFHLLDKPEQLALELMNRTAEPEEDDADV